MSFKIENHQKSKRVRVIKFQETDLDRLIFPFKKHTILSLEYKPFSRFSLAKSLDEDEINFQKLNNFRKYNSESKNDIRSNNHNIKYANSDKNYFNNILKTNKNVEFYNETDAKKEINYYNNSDFQKFDQLNSFPEYNNDNEDKINESSILKSNYSNTDYDEFNKIIPKTNIDNKKIEDQNKKIRIIDYGKVNENEKKLKNKMGIDKIKIVYFD